MKTLTLFRHAKSSWKFCVPDSHRPLNARGMQQASQMASSLRLPLPDQAMSSHAIRAISTACIYVDCGALPAERLRISDALYEASDKQILSWIGTLDDAWQDIWLFGHNPGFNDLIERLLGTVQDNLVTSGYARLSFDCEHWRDCHQAAVTLVELNLRDIGAQKREP